MRRRGRIRLGRMGGSEGVGLVNAYSLAGFLVQLHSAQHRFLSFCCGDEMKAVII